MKPRQRLALFCRQGLRHVYRDSMTRLVEHRARAVARFQRVELLLPLAPAPRGVWLERVPAHTTSDFARAWPSGEGAAPVHSSATSVAVHVAALCGGTKLPAPVRPHLAISAAAALVDPGPVGVVANLVRVRAA